MTDNRWKSKYAFDCLSLVYKYNNLIDCVSEQRPSLLSDEVLAGYITQIKVLETLFEDRIRNLAHGEEE